MVRLGQSSSLCLRGEWQSRKWREGSAVLRAPRTWGLFTLTFFSPLILITSFIYLLLLFF